MRELDTDILILGSGGAGLFAALHAHKAAPGLSITVAVKGLLGKCGCTRMVQGGSMSVLNVAATCAGAGIIVGVVTLTGLGLKFSSIVLAYAGNSLLLTAIYTALIV